MVDNGLVSLGSKYIDKNGIFQVTEKRWFDFHGDARRIYSCRDWKTEAKYFVKKCSSPKEQSAEVLLSQIYARHGFTTTISLPANGNRIISNDIADKPNAELIYDFFVRRALRDRSQFSPDAIARIQNETCDVHDLKSASLPRWEQLFTPQALAERFRWDAFTLASGNSDDHLDNSVVYVNKKGIAEEIGHFDYGHEFGPDADKSKTFLDKEYFAFYNGKMKVDRDTFLCDLAGNKRIARYFDAGKVANELGSVDVVATARDIEQTIGYSPSQYVVDTLARSFEQTAEDLLDLTK